MDYVLKCVKKTKLLPGFPAHLFGSAKRSLQEKIIKERRKLAFCGLSDLALLFESLIPAEFLDKIARDKRKSVYTEIVVFWAWLGQVLLLNTSCKKAVSMIRSWSLAHNMTVPKENNAGYCTARKRIRLEFIQSIFKHIVTVLNRRIRLEDQWHGFVVKSIDGTSVQLMDTVENQELYPQPSNQKKGCGFPVMGVAAVLNHAHGGIEGFVTAHPHEHDHKTAHKLIGYFQEGDLALADTAYSSYEFISRLNAKRVHSLMPVHQARKVDFRRGVKLGVNERLYTWEKPKNQSKRSNLTEDQWDEMSDTLEIRIIRFWYKDKAGKLIRKHLVTTLLDTEKHPWEELVSLYLERWDIELRFRDIKTTMGFEALKVKTPEMARKSITMAVIGCNLIKAISQEAALDEGVGIRNISFKGVLDEVTSNAANFRLRAMQHQKRRVFYQKLIELSGEQRLNIRPFRREPRAIKKRPKPFPRLTQPRSEWKAERSKDAA